MTPAQKTSVCFENVLKELQREKDASALLEQQHKAQTEKLTDTYNYTVYININRPYLMYTIL